MAVLHMVRVESSARKLEKAHEGARDRVARALCHVGTEAYVGVVLLMDSLREMKKLMDFRQIWPFEPGTGLLLGARVRRVTWTSSESDAL